MMKNSLIILIVVLITTSCQKEKAIDFDPEFQGAWRHDVDSDHFITIFFDYKGKGNMVWMHNGLIQKLWQKKPWYVKENQLLYSRSANDDETFTIDLFPIVSDSTFNFDEDNKIYAGEKYFVIDGMAFWEN